MPKFQCKVKTKEGKLINKVVLAQNYAEAYHTINKGGMEAVKITELGEKKEKAPKKMRLRDVTIFCRQMATMLAAGITLVRVFEILTEQAISSKDNRQAAIYQSVYKDIQQGYTLTDSMKNQGDVFPGMLMSMAAAGEVSGNLDIVMDKTAEFYESRNKLMGKVESALMYPKILLCMIVIIMFALFTWVLPQFFVVFETLNAELPTITRVIIKISDFIRYQWYWLVIAGVTVVLIWQILMTIDSFVYGLDEFITKVPVLGKAMQKLAIANFTSTMGLLYSSGVPMIQSLEIAADALDNRHYTSIMKQITLRVGQGIPLSVALKDEAIFEPMVASLISIGEESGNLENILASADSFYRDEAEQAYSKLATAMEPIIIVIIGVLVLVIVAAVLMPTFSLATQVTG